VRRKHSNQRIFLKVSAKCLAEVLKRDSLRINEGKAFVPILAWLKAHCKNPDDKDEIKKVGAEIIPLIRFPTMSTSDIASKVVPLGILDQSDVLELFTYLAVRDKSKPGTTLPPLNKKWNTTRRRYGLELTYVSMWDTNGILYYIGTKKGTQGYTNPQQSGDIIVTTSQIGSMSGSVDYLVGRTGNSCWIPLSNYETNGSWFQIDLKKYEININYYTIRDSAGGGSYQLRNWVLEGSKDGNKWETVREHINDSSITSQGVSAGWSVQSEGYYRFVRVRVTGNDASGRYYFLFCSGIEFYGTICETD